MRRLAAGAGAATSGLIAGTLGWATLLALAVPFTLLLAFAAWVITNSDRTRRVQQLIRTWRGIRR